ncbi:MAG: phosphatase PAP2 family protein [Pseudomonadota bacterium]
MPSKFWFSHFIAPFTTISILLIFIWSLGWDEQFANFWFYDSQLKQWIGKGAGEWWSQELLHKGGQRLVRATVVLTVTVWCLTFVNTRLRPLRFQAAYVLIAMLASIALVGVLKAISNVDCPWDLAAFGGSRPHIGIFQDRPDSLPRAQCFPGAHSSSGFAFMSFYFAMFHSAGRLKYFALLLGISIGFVFAFGQESRGAHFLSHDLTGALLVWTTILLLFVQSHKLRLRHGINTQ